MYDNYLLSLQSDLCGIYDETCCYSFAVAAGNGRLQKA